jgi:hypothetical protein
MTKTANPVEAAAPGWPSALPFQQAETEAVAAALEALPREGRPTLAQDAEFMLARCLDYPAEAERLYGLLSADGVVFVEADLRSRLAALRDLCVARIDILRRLGAMLAAAATREPARLAEVGPASARLERLLGRVEHLLAWLGRPVPPVDPQRVAEARARFARGEYEDVEVILRRVRDGGTVTGE